MIEKALTRRDALKLGGALVGGAVVSTLPGFWSGCNDGSSGAPSANPAPNGLPAPACQEATNVTRGPYFVDSITDTNISDDVMDTNIPERSNITADTEGSAGTQPGLPLNLKLAIGSFNANGNCGPIANARVDIWHCNAQGVYSDISMENSSGENYLRGYQMTDANGQVAFVTIYPGWYMGRAVHIHIKVRIFDGSGNITTEATTQLFFNDSTTDAVYAANSAYSRSTSRDTLNSVDSVYTSENPTLLVSLSGSVTSGYNGVVSLGIQVGTLYGG